MIMIIVTTCQYPEQSHFKHKSFLCKRSMPFSISGVIFLKHILTHKLSMSMRPLQNSGVISTIIMQSLLFRKVALQLAVILFSPTTCPCHGHAHILTMNY